MSFDPWNVTRRAYTALGEEGAYYYKEGEKVRRAMEVESGGDETSELMAVAILSDELLRQVNNFDPTVEVEVKDQLKMLWDICNTVANDEDLKKAMNQEIILHL